MLEALIELFLYEIVFNLLCRLASLVMSFARWVKKCWHRCWLRCCQKRRRHLTGPDHVARDDKSQFR